MPIELQRNFTLMRDLDSRAQGLMQNIDSLADNYLRNQKTVTPDDKKEQLDKIQSLFNKAKVCRISFFNCENYVFLFNRNMVMIKYN